ncbi:MAG TPA: hypothetical protein PKY44_02040 [Bacteroidales bacterium]|nr:hypothetical protein [Bacteroidales bacterium]
MKNWTKDDTSEKNINDFNYKNIKKNIEFPNDNENIQKNNGMKDIIIFLISLFIESLIFMLVWNKIIIDVVNVNTLTYFQSFFIFLLIKIIIK